MSMSQVGSGLPRLLAERYELVEQLATGGMTSVWRGHDRVLGRDVVVKVLHPELAADERFRSRFHEEAVNAARLTHPGIVALYDTGEQGDVAYIVMELVEGVTLRDVLDRHGPIPAAQAARLASEVTLALDYAHEAGVVHRNLKPGNVLLAGDGTVKVADFSIARAATDDDPARTGEILGADGYLAPEMVNGGLVDGRSDVYALGACLYEMLTGRPPGPGPVASVPPRALVAGVPRELDGVVLRAMAPDPAERFPSARAMAAALARLAAGADGTPAGGLVGPAEPHDPPGDPAIAPARGFLRHEGRWLGWTLALVLLAGVLVVVGLALSRDGVGSLFGGSSGGPKGTSSPTTAATTVHVVGATSFDPLSRGGGNEENEDQAGLAIDGNRTSAWNTEGYNDNLGAYKDGVGLVLDVGEPRRLGRLTLDLVRGGAEITVYGSDAAEHPDTLDGWERLDGPRTADGDRATFDLGGRDDRYLLVWFTSLPQDSDGKYRDGIAFVTLRS
jgi:tRNA A-37 threonylcarbamoyl transferase component Bud32